MIEQDPAPQERESHKLAGLATTLAGALRARRQRTAATLAAESGATVFGIAFTQWIRENEQRSLPDLAADVLHELQALTAQGGIPGRLPFAEDLSALRPRAGEGSCGNPCGRIPRPVAPRRRR